MTTLVIGLGNIGMEIAERLHYSTPTIGVDTDPQRRDLWRSRTSAAAHSALAEVDWKRVTRAIVVVRESRAALEVATAVPDFAHGPIPCHIMSTLDYDDALRLAQLPSASGVRFLEQPISGGASGAAAGSLTIFSAGPIEPADEEFLHSTLAQQLLLCQEYGAPTVIKLLNNTVAGYQLQLSAWALEAGTALGISPQLMHQALQSSSGASTIAGLAPEMGSDQAALLVKDLRLTLQAIGSLPSLTPQSLDIPQAWAWFQTEAGSSGEKP